jgi:hypothetical protein
VAVVAVTKKQAKALMSAALSVPGVITGAQAQSAPGTEARLSYDYYRDYQPGSNRMRVSTPSLWLKSAVDDKTSVTGSFVLDSVSGASPYYYSSLSSASIHDTRKAADLSVQHEFEKFAINVGGAFSQEDDYKSKAVKAEVKTWSSDKNTTYNLGVSYADDDIGSTLDPTLSESRNTTNYILGVTQVINERSLAQVNVTYGSADGFLTDPYKTYDNRPHSKEQWAFMTRYVLYLPSTEAALHTDYRYYRDTFGLDSHMVEVSLYQPVMSSWIIRPSIRYYSQSKADFFEGTYPPPNPGAGFYTADQRMGDFGGINLGLKLIKDFGQGLSAQISFDFMEQRPEWKLGGGTKVPEIENFYAEFVSVGIVKRF